MERLGDMFAGLIILGTLSGVIPAILIIGFIKLLGTGVKAYKGEIGMTEEEINKMKSRHKTSLQEEERKALRERLYK